MWPGSCFPELPVDYVSAILSWLSCQGAEPVDAVYAAVGVDREVSVFLPVQWRATFHSGTLWQSFQDHNAAPVVVSPPAAADFAGAPFITPMVYETAIAAPVVWSSLGGGGTENSY